MTEAISYVVDADGICTLTMDLPNSKMNVLGAVLQPELDAKLIRAASDPAVRGIIITSAKAAFVAGGDLKALGGDNISQSTVSKGEMARQFMTLSNMLRRMETCGKPVACALNGTAMGGGFEIALASHYRVVADDPKIQLGLPEASVGLLAAGGGTQRLARMLGVQGALPLLMQGKIMNPAAALAAKVVDAVVPKDQMLAECKRWLLEVGDAVKPWDKKGFQVPGGGSSLDKSFRNSFSGTIAMVRGNGYGNYPAPEMICAAVYEGLQLPMDKALGIEAKYFTKLMLDPVARNLIRTMFINKGKADALDGRPEGVAKMVFKKIGVVGAGTMGAGIAFNAAKSGIEVVLIDRDLPSAEKGKAYAEKKLNRDIEKGRSTQDKADAILARIHPTIDYAALGDVQLAIETVFEDKKVKADVLPKIEAAIPADAFIGSNTSRMPISELADYLADPARFIGLHFFSPVERMPLIEIIRGKKTSPSALAWALDFTQAMRKTPIKVNDSFGFFTSRFIGSFIASSYDMVEQGVTPALVENGARMVGMPMGALTISDAIGLDVGYHAAKAEAEANGTEYKGGISARLVEAGRNGLKNGKGFYDYGEGGAKNLWPDLSKYLPVLPQQPDIEEVKKRILYAQLAEGARAFAEGVLFDAIGGDLGATLGVGFPAYLGGPFAAMDTIGISQVVAELDRLTGLYGDKYAAPQLLRDMAVKGQTFHGDNPVTAPSPQPA